MKGMFVLAPLVGLEPTTYELTVRRSTDWAKEEYKVWIDWIRCASKLILFAKNHMCTDWAKEEYEVWIDWIRCASKLILFAKNHMCTDWAKEEYKINRKDKKWWPLRESNSRLRRERAAS